MIRESYNTLFSSSTLQTTSSAASPDSYTLDDQATVASVHDDVQNGSIQAKPAC